MTLKPDELLVSTRRASGALAEICLNAEHRLNAISPPMCGDMTRHLLSWQQHSPIRAAVIEGAGERAFCAGGDIQYVYRGIAGGNINDVLNFFRAEYTNVWHVHNFRWPYIAFADGVTMGGGVGVSFMGNLPVVTEKTLFAMPETAIGYLPDVGMGLHLSRLGAIGSYIALTGARLDAADLLYLGLAEFAVASRAIPAVKSALAAGIDDLPASAPPSDYFVVAASVLATHRLDLPASKIACQRAAIEHCFSETKVGAIVDNLAAYQTAWSEQTLAALQRNSPTMLAVTLHHLTAFKGSTLADVLQREFSAVHKAVHWGDLVEGIRAQVIDKDRNPRWREFDIHNYGEDDLAPWFAAVDEPLGLVATQ